MNASLALNSRSSTSPALPHDMHPSSTMSIGAGDRIELLKLLRELRIQHIIASTEIEIALEMEQQCQGVQQRTNDANEECDRLSKEIDEVQKKLELLTSTPYGNEDSGLLHGSKTRNQVAEEGRSMADAGEAGQAKHLAADDICCVIAGDRAEVESDTDGDTCQRIQNNDRSDLCLCKRLAAWFESNEGLVANHISCHCGGSGNYDCYLQLHLPHSQAGWTHSDVILGSIHKSGAAPRSLGIPKRRQSIGSAMRRFRLPTRDEQQCV